ncbi:hypothetical protein B0J15DRAFT_463583 [Fusarium solani]|uniref:Uncharacterized protein n=1 Tax=Fusarium solani TaxID=169388 RepID=A0A9P9KQ59_FUSSL|nr:uncharacterized protein B0J15DRAFT_463583 [Fusarium solani]KAH7266458.1 hypothetical protein B0J15DRAFT_463583 [Fusarium solani]
MVRTQKVFEATSTNGLCSAAQLMENTPAQAKRARDEQQDVLQGMAQTLHTTHCPPRKPVTASVDATQNTGSRYAQNGSVADQRPAIVGEPNRREELKPSPSPCQQPASTSQPWVRELGTHGNLTYEDHLRVPALLSSLTIPSHRFEIFSLHRRPLLVPLLRLDKSWPGPSPQHPRDPRRERVQMSPTDDGYMDPCLHGFMGWGLLGESGQRPPATCSGSTESLPSSYRFRVPSSVFNPGL